MFKRFYKNRYGYSRWDGTQRIEGLDADDILNALSDDYLEGGNLQQTLKRLMQEGIRSEDGRRTMGLRELMERMRNQRNEQLNRYNMASGVMDDLREKLEEIKNLKRSGIQHRLDETQEQPSEQSQPSDQQQDGGASPRDAQPNANAQPSGQSGQAGQSGQSEQGQSGESGDGLTPEQKRKMLEMIAKRKQEYLEKLPEDIPGQIKGLSEYDFMDDEAREKFNELLASLQQQMMQQFFQGMQQSLQNMTPEDIAKLREMIRDLNKMLRERQEGREPDFDSFMQKLELTPNQITAFQQHAPWLETLGFTGELFGPHTIRLRAAPSDMPEGRVARVLELLLTDLAGERTPDRRLRETAALIACHSAVRFGDPLTPETARELLRSLAATDEPISCPHGRPTTLILPDEQLRRLFKRP